jgi:hypothetical protein
VSRAGAGIQARQRTWGRNHYGRPDIGIGGQISPVSRAGLRGSSYGLELNAERAKEEAHSGGAATKKSRGKAADNPASKAKKTGGLFDQPAASVSIGRPSTFPTAGYETCNQPGIIRASHWSAAP